MNPKLGDLVEFLSRGDRNSSQYAPKIQSGIVDEIGKDLKGNYIALAGSGKQHLDNIFVISLKTVKGLKEWLSTDE